MYWGSVRFFKHLILLLGFCLWCGLIINGIYLNVKLNSVLKEIELVKTESASGLNRANAPAIGTNTVDVEFEESDLHVAKPAEEDRKGEYIAKESLSFKDPIEDEALNEDSSELSSKTATGKLSGKETETVSLRLQRKPSKYSHLFEELYVENPPEFIAEEDAVYLTFDDGPLESSKKILDLLDEENVKATFFVVADPKKTDADLVQELIDRGHSVGIHSSSHDYRTIYSSVESFLEDFNTAFSYIYEATGFKPQIYRFPGGSVNSYNQEICMDIIAEMDRRGFVFYDWNVSAEDTTKNATAESVFQNSTNLSYSGKYNRNIILLHDTKADIVFNALPKIIDFYLERGYAFNKISNSTLPVTFIQR